jgi:hypothetical protein
LRPDDRLAKVHRWPPVLPELAPPDVEDDPDVLDVPVPSSVVGGT